MTLISREVTLLGTNNELSTFVSVIFDQLLNLLLEKEHSVNFIFIFKPLWKVI